MTLRLGVGVFVAFLAMGLSGCALEGADVGESADDLRVDCSLVRCALPLCAEGQHLVQSNGDCCPRCVGPTQARTDRCAAVLCAAVECADGEVAVTPRGQCCPQCRPLGPVAECASELDCPQYYCIACPCPVSECSHGQCVTWTPDESTCGGAL